MMGLWFVGLYIGIWYVLHDALANRGISRTILVNGVLLGGLVVVLFGMRQVFAGTFSVDVRPVSTLGNPNALGGFLVVLIPLALERTFSAVQRPVKVLMAIYTVMAVLLLFLSFSRGAWVGTGATLVTFGALMLRANDLISVAKLRLWWRKRSSPVKLRMLIGVTVIITTAGYAFVVLLSSFALGGRSISLRTYIWDAALTMFAEKPLAGHGLFTFGRELTRLASSPPLNPHSHAHNIPLNVAAELGLVGIAALVVSVFVMIRAIRRNWAVAHGREQTALVGSIAAVVGFGVHHLLDMPSMMPAIALSGLLVLVLATAPFVPVSLASWQRVARPALVGGLWVVLLPLGLWSSGIYSQYYEALVYGVSTQDYRGAAERLDVVIAVEPEVGLYHMEQGFLYGMAASEGDLQAAMRGIQAYERYLDLEGHYAVGWANQAALYAQLDDYGEAFEKMILAVVLAPDAWSLAFRVGVYAEVLDEAELAREMYERALSINRDVVLFPEWGMTELQREVALETETEVSPLAQVLLLIKAVQIREAQQVWDENGLSIDDSPAAAIIGAQLGVGGVTTAPMPTIDRDSLDVDFSYGVSYAYAQFLRQTIPRQFLPQVGYTEQDLILLHLLAES